MKFSLPFLIWILFYFTGCQRQQINEPADTNLPPDIPSGFEIYTAHDGFVSLDWTPNSESNLLGYNVYRSSGDTNNFKLIDFTKNNYYLDIYLQYDTAYFYRITAVNNKNLESQPTNYVSAKPENLFPPAAPYSVYINARNWYDTLSIVLNWNQPPDYDIAAFQIYRDTIDNFDADSSTFIASTKTTYFTDFKNLILLQKYFYKIITIDRGNLKSRPSSLVSDEILDLPELVSPPDNITLDSIPVFRFRTVGVQANYKFIIQTNEFFGVIEEIDFSSDKINEIISIPANGLYLGESRKYYWRVLTYTASETDPNSFSKLFSFTYNPTY